MLARIFSPRAPTMPTAGRPGLPLSPAAQIGPPSLLLPHQITAATQTSARIITDQCRATGAGAALLAIVELRQLRCIGRDNRGSVQVTQNCAASLAVAPAILTSARHAAAAIAASGSGLQPTRLQCLSRQPHHLRDAEGEQRAALVIDISRQETKQIAPCIVNWITATIGHPGQLKARGKQ